MSDQSGDTGYEGEFSWGNMPGAEDSSFSQQPEEVMPAKEAGHAPSLKEIKEIMRRDDDEDERELLSSYELWLKHKERMIDE